MESAPATVPGLVVLMLAVVVVGGSALYWWLREVDVRRREELAGVEEWERFKRACPPRSPRSLP